ncbi:uncharacterized protein LOC116122180 [Pistacia vera]|uniref:uncharacterized protein LOC116122180 n=1 Tax=Pistacia vera TaxID=55513 RepID=UPI001263B2FA|nr:uncharacterized protein LOC116122180 [Pistacia vera]
MASSKGIALALLLFFALVLISVPSTSAEEEKKEKQCKKDGVSFHCHGTLKKAALGEKLDKDCPGCCKYLKEVDATKAATCLCKAVPDKYKESEKIADTLTSVLKTCEINCPIPAGYKCSKD